MRELDTATIVARLQPFIDGGLGGLAWGVSTGAQVAVGALGHADPDTARRPMRSDGIFRIASVSKPISAVAVLRCVADGLIGLDDPLWGGAHDVLAEFAEARVQVDPAAPIDGVDAGPTVEIERPLTLRDLLSFRCGYGMSFDFASPQPVLEAMWGHGIGPAPTPPDCGSDEYVRRLAALPLADQPGTRWRYHCGSDLATVVVERLRGDRFDVVLRRGVVEPLGMVDTTFVATADQLVRLGDCRMYGEDGVLGLWDVAGGRWSTTPEFFSGGTGLVSTVEDLLRFGRLFLDGGAAPDGTQVLPSDLVEEMCRDQLTAEQREVARISSVDASLGWGLGVAVRAEAAGGDDGGWPGPGVVFWDGGLGARWIVDRERSVCAVLLTTDSFSSPEPPAVMDAFVAAVEESVGRA